MERGVHAFSWDTHRLEAQHLRICSEGKKWGLTWKLHHALNTTGFS